MPRRRPNPEPEPDPPLSFSCAICGATYKELFDAIACANSHPPLQQPRRK